MVHNKNMKTTKEAIDWLREHVAGVQSSPALEQVLTALAEAERDRDVWKATAEMRYDSHGRAEAEVLTLRAQLAAERFAGGEAPGRLR